MKTLLNLPNIITCCNVQCGCMAVFFGLNGQVGLACLCIILGAVFDFFDGMTARALHISGPVGKELDSLADMVSFGLIFSMSVIIGGLTPPVGSYLFVTVTVVKSSVTKLVPWMCVMIVVDIFVLLLVAVFPSFCTWLPNALLGPM